MLHQNVVFPGLSTRPMYPRCLRRIFLRDAGVSLALSVVVLHAVPRACSRTLHGPCFLQPRPPLPFLYASPSYHLLTNSSLVMSSSPQSSSDINIHESKASNFYAAAITSYVLAVAAVALRFWARKLMRTELRVDDWAIAGALEWLQDRVHISTRSPDTNLPNS